MSFQFTLPEDAPFETLSLSHCQQRLQNQALSLDTRLSLLRQLAIQRLAAGERLAALAGLEEALALKPDDPSTLAVYGLVQEQTGQIKDAIQTYQKALDRLSDPTLAIGAELWYRQGNGYRTQGNYKQAIACYTQALNLRPDYAEALSSRGVTLTLTGRHKQGKAECDRALTLAPDSAVVMNNRGIALMAARQHRQALAQFEAVLAVQPDFVKSQYNQALVLVRLGQDQQALESLNSLLHGDSAFALSAAEPWTASAWTLQALLLLKQRQFQASINSCQRAQALQPQNYAAALYKITATIASGKVWSQLRQPKGRREVGRDLGIVGSALKYRLLTIVVVFAILIWGQGGAIASIRGILPIFLSFLIIGLIGMDLWRHKSRLQFVWKIYFRSGILTYPRAFGTLMATLFTFFFAYQYTPAFMHWGWANAVFGNPGNIIFQPINLLQEWSWQWPGPMVESLWAGIVPLMAAMGSHLMTLGSWFPLGFTGTYLFHIGDIHVTVATLLIMLFWLALLLGVPFWANLEERIFRQGANTWQAIVVRSVQFGLVHLLAGIPIVAGFVLIVPGFLFACRYKFVRDRHYRLHGNPYQADAAGVLASTADHAVYNAILMTMAIAAVLWEQTLA